MKFLNLAWLLLVLVTLDVKAFAVSIDSVVDTPRKGLEDGCYLLGRGPGAETSSNPGLKIFLKSLTDQIKNERWRSLHKYFHDRAKIKKEFGDRVEAILDHRYIKPRQFSVFGIWSFKSKEGLKDFYECERADQMRLISHSGYKSQYMIVYQIMGQNELGRLVFGIAPDKKKHLKIVGFHIQQWSHIGKNWLEWTEAGNASIKEGKKKSAYIHFDIAQKLLDGGSLVHYPYRKEILAARKEIFTQDQLVKQLQKDASNSDIVYGGTTMSRTDTGLMLRVQLEKEYNAEDLQNKCKAIGKDLLKRSWLDSVNGGVTCSYIPRGADPTQDSKLGGYTILRKNL